jgi:hypothetical protein
VSISVFLISNAYMQLDFDHAIVSIRCCAIYGALHQYDSP